MKNPYSMYKLYGQEKYSRILISLLAKNDYEVLPEFLLNENDNIVLSDKIIKENIPGLATIEPEIREQVYFLWLDKIRNDLQTFFDDYIPSTLDTIIKKKSGSKFEGQTIRESLYIGFKTILKEERALYLNESRKNEFVYLELKFDKLYNDTVKVFDEKDEMECETSIEKKTIKCKIDKTNFNYNENNKEEYKVYHITVKDGCDNLIHTVEVKAKCSEKKEEKDDNNGKNNDDNGLKGWHIALICVGGAIALLLVVFFVCRCMKKGNNIEDVNKVNNEKLLEES